MTVLLFLCCGTVQGRSPLVAPPSKIVPLVDPIQVSLNFFVSRRPEWVGLG